MAARTMEPESSPTENIEESSSSVVKRGDSQTLKHRHIANKGVRFAEVNHEQDVHGQTQAVTEVKAKQNVARQAAELLFGTGQPMSKKAAKRRRFWRKFATRANPRYWFHVLNRKLPIVLPDAPQRRYWDLMVMLFVIYNAVLVPYEVGYGKPAQQYLGKLDTGVDVIFWMDMLYNFRTAYIDHQANVIRDGRKIALHYMYTWFPIDLPASIPFDQLVLMFYQQADSKQLAALALLKTPRLLRLARLMRFFDRMKGANAFRMIRLLFVMAMVAHWVTCLWHLLYVLMKDHGHAWSFDRIQGAEITNFLNGYLNAFQLMIGNDIGPQNDLERVYCTFILVVGACFYAIIVGHMSLLVNNLNPTASRHKFKKDIVNNTIRYLGAPNKIAGRIDEYFDYLTSYSHPGPEGMSLLSQLPSSMFQDISAFMYKDLVKKVPLFKDCEEAFITQLLMRLKLGVYLPGEVIFRMGDVGHEMYFITKGNVAVMNKRHEMLTLLGKGGFFGELALLATARRTAQCAALSHCDLSVLSAHDLVAAMRDFPESAATVRERALARFNELQTAGNVNTLNNTGGLPRHLRKLNPDIGMDAEQDAEWNGTIEEGDEEGALEEEGDADGGNSISKSGGSTSRKEEEEEEGKEGAVNLDSLRSVIQNYETSKQWSDSTMVLVGRVQATIARLSGKMDTLHGKLSGIHDRLGKVEVQQQAGAGMFDNMNQNKNNDLLNMDF